MELQLTELLTRYGPVVLVWFDGLNMQSKYDGVRFMDLIHKLQPRTLINDRLGVEADYATPEQFIPTRIPTKGIKVTGIDPKVSENLKTTIPSQGDFRLWETCMTINGTWAYNANDHEYKSAQMLIRSLVEVASRGGNFLLNIGPRPDGTVQSEFQERLRAIGEWLQINGEAIYETTYGPVQGLASVRTTSKNQSIFVHVFDWPSGSLELPGIDKKVVSARLLAGGKPLTFQQKEGKLQIDLPAQAPDANVSVITLTTL
jgi:alpha-L-fucosidase